MMGDLSHAFVFSNGSTNRMTEEAGLLGFLTMAMKSS
jgi:hypothetical protein